MSTVGSWFYVVDYLRLNHVVTRSSEDVARSVLTPNIQDLLVYVDIGECN